MLSNSSETCSNGCGFYGSPDFQGMCSKCYKDTMKKNQAETTPVVVRAQMAKEPTTTLSIPKLIPSVTKELKVVEDKNVGSETKPVEKPKSNRCWTCKKKVGLTAISCRCGGIYCGLHRYTDSHGCTYDYKATGKDKIAKDNPLVDFEKISKI